MSARTALPATISSGTSLSDTVDILGYDVVAVAMPSAWDAASVTFQTSHDGETFYDVIDSSGSEVSLAVDVDEWVQVPETAFRQFGRFVKARSGTSATAVNQTAERVLQVIGRCG